MSTLNSKFRKGATAVAVVAGLATALVAVAQQGPGYGPGMMGGGGPGGMMGGGPAMMFAGNGTDMAKFQQDRLGQLKSQLGITAEQQPSWDSYAAKAAEQAAIMQGMHQAMSVGTAPERMALAQQLMGERQKAMASMSESFNKLYEVLTPKQREVFDRSYGPMHRHG